MPELPSNEFVELRNGAYYVRGTRIGLDVLIWPLRRGELCEDLAEEFPDIGRARMTGIVAFINAHPDAIETYLDDQARRWEEMTSRYPMDPDLALEWRDARERLRKSA